MRLLALITGILSMIAFATMLTVLLEAPFYVDIDMATILEIRGYGLLLLAAPLLGMGLLLAAYELEGSI